MKLNRPLLLKNSKVAETKGLFTVQVLERNNDHDQKLVEKLFDDHDVNLDPRGSLGLQSIQKLCDYKLRSLEGKQTSISIGIFTEADSNNLVGYCPSVIIYQSLLGKQAVIDVPGVIRNGFIAKKGLTEELFAKCLEEISSFLYEEMNVVFVEMRLGCGLPTGVASMIQRDQSFIMDLRCESHWLLELRDGVASLDDYLQNQASRNVRRRIIKKLKKATQNGVQTRILRRSDFVANLKTDTATARCEHLRSIKELNKEFHSTKMAAKVGKKILELFGAPSIQDDKILEASLCAHGVEDDQNGFCVASFVNNEMIAFMTFEVGETCAHAMYTGKNTERCNPTYAYFALLYAAIEESARLGVKYIDFHATTGLIKKELGCEPAGDMHWIMLSKSFPHLLLWKIIGLLLLPMIRFLEGR